LRLLDEWGFDASVLFPNYGLLWEKWLAEDRVAQRANARAYNRFMADVCADGDGRLFGVAHLLLHDPAWAVEEIRRVSAQGVRLAMIAPAPVDGKPLSHPDFDPVWRACSDEGVASVFHVSGFESPLDRAWHVGETDDGGLLLDSIFLWLAPAVALTNLILNGTLERFPDLRLGVVELTAGWVPSFLLHLDGATDFFAERHGGPFLTLAERPSHYFLRQVRVAALPYEMPNRLVNSVGEDTFMVGSDWPHAEGVADPMTAADRASTGLGENARGKLLGANAAWLLGLEESTE
jgi:predicted TIM-barrel fold metal-dependent hydrolase